MHFPLKIKYWYLKLQQTLIFSSMSKFATMYQNLANTNQLKWNIYFLHDSFWSRDWGVRWTGISKEKTVNHQALKDFSGMPLSNWSVSLFA